MGDRHAIERLVRKFHQSLQLSPLKWINQLPRERLWAIVLGVGALLVMLALHGFYAQVFTLSIFFSMVVLQADRHALRDLTSFWIVERDSNVIGCAKLFCHNTYSEAYLVYVDPAWRGQGYGSRLVQRLTEEATLPLYLASQPHRLQFYMRLGFVPLPTEALPMIVRSRLGIDRYHQYGIVGMVFGRSARGNTRVDPFNR